jgi:DNA polymerase-3 subunit gamma/tau
MDVIEMDAASRTGVGDIREIIETVQYLPSSARYKVYIIDEVHMLSTSAFNALLKTLEEPPPHVKFIFATTETRKIPVTILSRCQRFDLKRVDIGVIESHLKDIASREAIDAEANALKLIAKASEGSVRDSLSLLDQAIALSNGDVSERTVIEMLGLGDGLAIQQLFHGIVTGETSAVLATMADQINRGADPVHLMTDLAELVSAITKLKIINKEQDGDQLHKFMAEMAAKLSIPFLSRMWQGLLKGISETRLAANPVAAAEMVLIRICYMSALPLPVDVIQNLQSSPADRSDRSGRSGRSGMAMVSTGALQLQGASYGNNALKIEPVLAPAEPDLFGAAAITQDIAPSADPQTIQQIADLFKQNGEMLMYQQIRNYVKVVELGSGSLEIAHDENLSPNFAGKLAESLQKFTGNRWIVSFSGAPAGVSIAQEEDAKLQKQRAEIIDSPLVKQALAEFPGSVIESVAINGKEVK